MTAQEQRLTETVARVDQRARRWSLGTPRDAGTLLAGWNPVQKQLQRAYATVAPSVPSPTEHLLITTPAAVPAGARVPDTARPDLALRGIARALADVANAGEAATGEQDRRAARLVLGRASYVLTRTARLGWPKRT